MPPGKLRSITDRFVPEWKKKRAAEGALYSKYKWYFMNSREWEEAKFQQQVKQMRAEVATAFFHTSSLNPESSRTSPARGHMSFAIRHYGKVG